jgi:hypothetical protein
MAATQAPAPSFGIDVADLVKRLVKYALEGLAVAVACYLLPGKKLRVDEIGTIALTALAVFAILDIYAPSVGSSARTGAGFGLGQVLHFQELVQAAINQQRQTSGRAFILVNSGSRARFRSSTAVRSRRRNDVRRLPEWIPTLGHQSLGPGRGNCESLRARPSIGSRSCLSIGVSVSES